MKLTILFASLADYTVAFFRHLALHHGWRIQLVYQPATKEAPYASFDLGFCDEAFPDTPEGRVTMHARVAKFGARCILMCSWNHDHYMKVARTLKRDGVYVVSTMDNQWRGSAKQWLGAIGSKLFLKPSIDTFLVAGDRQAEFAARLGYKDVLYGYYAADIERFTPRANDSIDQAHNFLFVGRLVQEKGLDILLGGYQLYRSRVEAPWNLTIAGTGPLQSRLNGVPGVDHCGFVQPADLPSVMHRATVFVLPSNFEPWGVVIHEAAAAGLPIICTTACGASTYFVRDGVNGFLIAGGVERLAQAMQRISAFTSLRRSEMSAASLKLASLWQPPMLARYFSESLQEKLDVATRLRADH